MRFVLRPWRVVVAGTTYIRRVSRAVALSEVASRRYKALRLARERVESPRSTRTVGVTPVNRIHARGGDLAP